MKKHHSASVKARIALEAIRSVDPLSKIASANRVHPIQVGLWKKKAERDLHLLFDTNNSEARKMAAQEDTIHELHRLIGEREAELVWLQKKSSP
jgi:transposase-like protein